MAVTVAVPVAVLGLKSRAVKLYGVLAAQGWPCDVTAHRAAQLTGWSWNTAQAALEDLRAAGWIDHNNRPVGVVAK